jgi:MoCo/4Fe-4S cofactor protein with predicted Tat translocation signal
MNHPVHDLPKPRSAAPQFWRSLDELAGTEQFQEMLAREFPSLLPVAEDLAGRRNFLKLMAASLALAGLTGCARQPEETIVPYVNMPEELADGKPLYFATAMPRSGDAIGLLVKSHMGRPIKVEGNPDHPASRGATDAIAQASILTMYDPDRSQTVLRSGLIDTWDNFLKAIATERERLRGQAGRGFRILTETVTSPSMAALIERLLKEFPEAHWHQYEPLNDDARWEGSRLAFGRPLDAVYHFDRAETVLSLDADFMQEMRGSVRYARDFISRRQIPFGQAPQNRLYVLESTPTITGASADHRVSLSPQGITSFAMQLATRLGIEWLPASQLETGVSADWLKALLNDLQAEGRRSIIVAGRSQPAAVQALVQAMNERLGNIGESITLIEPVAARPDNQAESLSELVAAMKRGEVETLAIIGGNPVYNAPGELQFGEALDKVKLRIHLSAYVDETSQQCHWHVPEAHYLESWLDTRSYDGTASIVQPLIEPLYGGKTPHELLSVLLGEPGRSALDLVRNYWRDRQESDDFDRTWRRMLHDGLVAGSAASAVEVESNLAVAELQFSGLKKGESELTIEFRADPALGDGRFANNGWLQELPKPLSKITWDNVALISAPTAHRLGIASEDVLRIRRGEQQIEAPAWIMPGQPDDCVTLTFGYGRTSAGNVGSGVGYSAYELLPGNGAFVASVAIEQTGRKHRLATTQNHHSMEGRDIVRVTTPQRFASDSEHSSDEKHHGQLPSLYPEYDYDSQPNAWGMVINQTACIGCNACVVACHAENNIPVVGKEQVIAGREMHWLRIDRYFAGELAEPETYFQPMMCVHCEKAPCEVVCPVAATVHDAEGTNNMVYNRCVGTRYCSNNCPYKVRRFNFLQYTDNETPSLQLLRNPDVTVRSRGVMEKCTYCLQRISAGRIQAKVENRGIADGEVVTACQQACPTRAIVFGNLNDPQAQVTKLKSLPANYGVLADLNTQPRTTYLPRVVNVHPDLPEPSVVSPLHDGKPVQDKAHS